MTQAEEHTGANINGDTDNSQDIWIDVAVCEPTDHRVNDSLAGPAYATHKHSFSSPGQSLCRKRSGLSVRFQTVKEPCTKLLTHLSCNEREPEATAKQNRERSAAERPGSVE